MRKAPLMAATAVASATIAMAGMTSASATTGPSTTHSPSPSFTSARLTPVPTNRVHASGWASVRLQGDTARVTVNVKGLIPAPHAMHIHFMGEGECPQADDAGIHNGHRSLSTTDGLDDYGPIGTSLTTRGDTSPDSALAIARFPQVGTFHYVRWIHLTDDVARAVRTGNAVIVVHGIDYNGNKKYDNVLGVSDLTDTLPMEATAPAICGALTR